MDLFRAMRAFVAVADAGSMSAAAPRLGLTPAMVGQHVAALESRLGTRLINRTTRRQSLTDFGASYLDQCRDILERVALSEQQAETLRQEPGGLLRVTAPVTFGTEMLMPALGRYRDIAPKVTLDVVLTARNVDIVDEGFDVAFRISTPPDGRLIARRLAGYPMALCASPTISRAPVPRSTPRTSPDTTPSCSRRPPDRPGASSAAARRSRSCPAPASAPTAGMRCGPPRWPGSASFGSR